MSDQNSTLAPTSPVTVSEPSSSTALDLSEPVDNLCLESDNQASLQNRTSPFNDLPSEIRLEIYETALLNTNNASVLLQTCEQVIMEAQEFPHQRPTRFASQAKLFEWVNRSRTTNLKKVRTLTLGLTDVDLSPVLDQDSMKKGTGITVLKLYEDELKRLEQALEMLPNLHRLAITPPRLGSKLVEILYKSFLGVIPKRCPKLRELKLHDSSDRLKAVSGLQQIPRVIFNEDASILSGNDRRDTGTSTAVGSGDKEAKPKRPLSKMKHVK